MYRTTALPIAAALVLAAILPGTAAAQQVELGLWTGTSRANEVTTDVSICQLECAPSSWSPHYSRKAPVIGGMLRAPVHDRVALRAELGLAPKGYGPGEHSGFRVDARYVETPLLAELRLVRVGPVHLQAAAGFAPALMIYCRAGEGSGSAARECDEPAGDRVIGTLGPAVSHDLGWVAAGGVRLPTGGGNLLLELRHTRGLVDIRPEEVGRTVNRATTVTLGSTWRVRPGR